MEEGIGAEGIEWIIRNGVVLVLELKEVSADANLDRRWALVGELDIVSM